MERFLLRFPFFCVSLLTILLGSCISSLEKEVSVNPSVDQDKEYHEVYKMASSDFEIISNFETHYTLNATILSNAFLSAFAKRYQRLFNEKQPILEEASDKAGFYISLYTANGELNDLTDPSIWNIQMKIADKIEKPFLIKELGPKERWQPFFPSITPWSKEYLILFKSPSINTSTKELVKNSARKLIFSCSEGKVTISL